MNSAEFAKTLAVLIQYGLHPSYWDGDLFIIYDPNRDQRLVFSGDVDDEVPTPAFETLLEYIGMEEETFWQLYETI
ncbi:MAG: hypothetical protein BZY87_08930 [SAR202 cluster bacterium Io17-Chloro-G6]|nr:MAG: hypothetical protein BZY87_08930 [SAR202 cluster bacterium Io17-Chloro-G6]